MKKIFLLLFAALSLAAAEPLTFASGDWRLTVDSNNGCWRSLTYRGAECLEPTAPQAPLRLQLGGYKWVTPDFVSAARAGEGVRLQYQKNGFEITETVAFDAHGMPGLIERKLELTCPPEPTRFFNTVFAWSLPREGACYMPAGFFGDGRGIREVEGEPMGHLFRERAYRRVASSLSKGERFQTATYVMPLQYELPNGYTLTLLHDDRQESAKQWLESGGKTVTAQQLFQTEGWAEPGAKHEIGSAYLLVAKGSAPEVLKDKAVWRWYDAVGYKPPADRPEWLYDAVMYEFYAASFSSEDGFNVTREAFMPVLERMGFNTLWSMPVNTGGTYTPVDYFRFQPSMGGETEYRALVAEAQRRGMRFLQDIVPHGGTLADARERGNSAFAIRYSVNGKPILSGHGALSAKSPEWLDYLTRSSANFMTCGIDGFRIDQCGGSGPDWRKADFPPRDRAPEGIDPDWWQRSQPFEKLNPPPHRASLNFREGGLDWIRAIRGAVKAARPDGLVLAEAPFAVYSLEGDYIYDFMSRTMLHKFADMSRADFVAGLSLRLEEQYLTDPRYLLRMRYVELHDGPAAKAMVGLGAARALTAALYFSHGIPLAGYSGNGFDIGNGPFLRTLNRLRLGRPELRRGEADYLGVKSQVPEVFTVRRALDGKQAVGLVNFSSHPVTTALDLPGKSWFDVECVKAVDPGKIDLPPWGFRLLTNYKPEPDHGLGEAAAESIVSGVPQLTETAKAYRVSGGSYELTVDRATGLAKELAFVNRPKLENLLVFGAPVRPENAKVTVRKVKDGFAIDSEVRYGGNTLKLTWLCGGKLELSAELTGNHGDTAMLLFRAAGAARWQADTVEGRLDDYYALSNHVDADATWLSKSLYDHFRFYLTRWPRTILWQSEQVMLNPVQPAIRVFNQDDRGVEFTFQKLLKQPTAGMAIYSGFAGVPGWHLGLFFRQPSPLMRGVPQRFAIAFGHTDTVFCGPEKTGDFAAGKLRFHHDSDTLQIANDHYQVALKRRGGGISSWRDAAGKLWLGKQELISPKGYSAPVYSGGDPNGSYMMIEEGEALKFRFYARPRHPGRQMVSGPAFATVAEYIFDGSPRFRSGWGVLRLGALPAKGESFGWQAVDGEGKAVSFPAVTAEPGFPYGEWRNFAAAFEAGKVEAAAPADPLPGNPGWALRSRPDNFREYACPAVLVEAGGKVQPFPALTVNPGPWITIYTTRLTGGREGAGDLALKLRATNSVRIGLSYTLPPGEHTLAFALRGEGVPAGVKLEYEVSWQGGGKKNGEIELPEGTSDWKTIRLPMAFPTEARALAVRFKQGDVPGAVLIDDVGFEGGK